MRDAGRRPSTLALGVWLTGRDALVRVALGLAVIAAILAAAAATLGKPWSAAMVPMRATPIIAWSAGVMIAFGGALHAIPRDASDGVLALLRLRGVGVSRYVTDRVGGLALVIATGVGAATLAADAAALCVARPWLPALHATAASIVYVAAFAATLAPLAMAALGAPTRSGGYLTFLVVLVVPELLAPWTSTALPHGWSELTSIPAALAAVEDGVRWPARHAFAMIRALVALAALATLALAVVHLRIPRVDRGGDA